MIQYLLTCLLVVLITTLVSPSLSSLTFILTYYGMVVCMTCADALLDLVVCVCVCVCVCLFWICVYLRLELA